MTKTRRSVLLAGVSALLAGGASGQFGKKKKKEKPTRTVKGVVTDDSEDALRAVVQLKNTRTLDVKSFHTNARGQFYFNGLDPNIDYEIKAFAEGFRPKTRKVSGFDDSMELFYAYRLKRE